MSNKPSPRKQPKKVGYCRPPKDTQWKKGQSGNPSGKAKPPPKPPQQPLLECFAQQLRTPVEMTTGDRKVSVPLATAFAMKLLHETMMAPLQQKLSALALLSKLGVLNLHKMILECEPDEEEEALIFSEEDRRVLALIMKHGESGSDDDEA